MSDHRGPVMLVPPSDQDGSWLVVGPSWSLKAGEIEPKCLCLDEVDASFTINVARIADSGPFHVSGTEVLSTHPLEPGTILNRFFDVHPSGERFLVPLRGATSEGRTIFVQNWDEELNARLGTGR